MRRALHASLAIAALGLANAPPLATAAPAPTDALRFGSWGIDLAARDLTIRPGDDFFGYAEGTWVRNVKIPADRPSFGAFDELEELSLARTRGLLETMAAAAPATPANETDKVGAFYRAFMDERAVEARGLAPLAPALKAIRIASSRSMLADRMGVAAGGLDGSLYRVAIDADPRNPTAYTVILAQSGLGLPDRDYYLAPALAEKKTAYQFYVATLLGLAGWPDAAARAQDVVDYETAIAKVSWTRADRRDPATTNNAMTLAEVEADTPGFDWRGFMVAAGLGGAERLIVREKSAIPAIGALFAAAPLETLKAWSAFHLVDNAAPLLPAAFVQARFDFRDKVLDGTPELEPRWKRAAERVGSLREGMGDAVGRVYVARYFSPRARDQMQMLVENLRASFKARIERLDWMSPETKAAALEKLARYRIEIGYTSEWRDYAALDIRPGDLFGDASRALAANWAHERGRLGHVVDHAEWTMTPQTVNAYNSSSLNEVVFPAAILQPPFFDPDADPAVNYGAIGAVIGHEMTHGFDDRGRKYDATGRLRDWWTSEDAARFDARARILGAEYAGYDTGAGVSINPKQTMGENIADLGGLNLALDAYHASLAGKPAPLRDAYTGDQRVFLAWAQVYRTAIRPDALKEQIVVDLHSPDRYRALTPERNIDAWYDAYDIRPSDKLYIASDQRARIW